MTQDKEYCSVCGRLLELSDKSEMVVKGLQIEITTTKTTDKNIKKELIEYMKPYSTNKKYSVCFPCWLKSLGVKP